MFRLVPAFVWIGILVVTAACGSKDNSDPPAVLTEIENPLSLQIQWHTTTGANSSKEVLNLRPLLIDDQLFTIDVSGTVTSLNVENGRKNWSFDTPYRVITGLAGDRDILAVSSSDGDLAVYDRIDKGLQKRWAIQLSGEIRSQPAISGEQIFVRTVAGKLSAISLADGSVKWTVSRRIPALSLTGNSAPVVDGNRIIVGFDDGKMAAFDRRNGQTIWEQVISHASGRTEIERLVDIDGNFLLKDGVIYVSTYQGRLAALQALDGSLLWSRQFSSFQSIVADENALYISGDMSHLWSVDRRTGSSFWKQEGLHARKITAPQIVGDNIVVADLEGYVHWINKSDGSFAGRKKSSEFRYVSQPHVWRDNIIVYDSQGRLSAMSRR